MKRVKELNLGDIVKIKENGVPVEFTVVYKITPDKPFHGYTSGIVICRNGPDPIFHRIPLIILEDDKLQVDDDGLISAITNEEVDTNEIYSRS